jgi:hypothetical protein
VVFISSVPVVDDDLNRVRVRGSLRVGARVVGNDRSTLIGEVMFCQGQG